MSRKFLLAVDHSLNTDFAFNECVRLMDKENDQLFLVGVAEQPTFMPVSALGTMMVIKAEREVEIRTRELLSKYVAYCRSVGVKNHHTILGRGTHVGEVICKAVEKKNVDYLVVGRRGMSKIKRLFIGSTSKYCLEHATCSVIVVKMPPEMEKDHLAGVPVSTAIPATTHTGEKLEPILEEKMEYFHLEEPANFAQI